MIVLYIVILIYFNFNITSIVNVFMLSIEKKMKNLTWKYPKILAVVITHIIDPILQVKIIDWELLDHVY